MKTNKFFLLTLLTGFIIGAATIGCGSSATSAADDDSGYATATSLTALQAQVTKAFAQLQLVGVANGQTASISAAAARFNSARTRAAATNPCSNLGTEISADPFNESLQTYKSCTGYFGRVNTTTGEWVQPAIVWYDVPGCPASGANIVVSSNSDPTQGITPTLLATGEIFQIGGASGKTYFVAANAAPSQFSALSSYLPGQGCQAANITLSGYPLQLNAGGGMTGENDGSVALPISTVAPVP